MRGKVVVQACQISIVRKLGQGIGDEIGEQAESNGVNRVYMASVIMVYSPGHDRIPC